MTRKWFLVYKFIWKIAPIDRIFTRWKQRYSRTFVNILNDIAKLSGKIAYHEERIKFLQDCQKHHVVPNAIYKRMVDAKIRINLNSMDCFILSDMSGTHRNIEKWRDLRFQLLTQVLSELSLVDTCSLYKFLWNIHLSQRQRMQKKHRSSLNHLLIQNFGSTSINDTIFNISGVPLSQEEERVLVLGLNQYVSPKETNSTKVFTDMEQIAYSLSHEKSFDESKRPELLASLRKYAHELENIRLTEAHNAARQSKIVSNLKKEKGIILMRPDKGNGTVVMTPTQYNERMMSILNDTTKFKMTDDEIDWNDCDTQKRINSILQKIVSEKQFPSSVLDNVPKGCVIPRLYGLPKTHKANYPLRPVLSMTNSAYHGISRFVDDHILKPLLKQPSQFSVKNSFDFKNEITNIHLDSDETCVSFDVTSLFTNIPVDKTINIICDNLYRSDISPPKLGDTSLSESNCRLLLSTLCKNVRFVFNKTQFIQVEGLAMGSPLSGSFSEIFMRHLEDNLKLTLTNLKYYKRYVDDTFIVTTKEKSNRLFDIFNSQHPSIKFTQESADHFLDVKIHRDCDGYISTSVFRKETFTSLYNNFSSFSPRRYKSNLVSTLFYRARNLCSTQHLENELKFLYAVLKSNGYPTWFIDRHSKPKSNLLTTVPKKKFFFDVQYYGRTSETIGNNIRKGIERIFYHLKAIPTFRTKTLCPDAVKDIVPFSKKPMVTYQFSCPCGARYVGKSERCLDTRIKEHIPRWLLSSNSRPKSKQLPQSAITRHLCECERKDQAIQGENHNFSVHMTARNSLHLSIQESVTIRLTKPQLCAQKERLFLLKLL